MRIVQNSLFLKELVRAAHKGTIVPAAFQRPYVWARKDVVALIESIQKGYPTGSFLLWTPYGKANLADAVRPRLGPFVPGAEAEIESVLLDGQNRLASLAWLMHDLSAPLPQDMTEHELQVWGNGDVLAVDLETQKFEFMPAQELKNGLRLTTHAMLDYDNANRTIRELWNGPWRAFEEARVNEAVKWFDKLQGCFMNARTVATDIQGATVEEARDAFLHICKVGVPMAESDFEAAVSWASPSR